MTPQSYTTSFRGTSSTPLRDVAQSIVKALCNLKFERTSVQTNRRALFTPQTLEIAHQDLRGTLDDWSKLQMKPTTAAIERRLTRCLEITTITMDRRIDGNEVVILYGNRNWLPAIAIDLWTRARPKLPAGFLTINARSNRVMIALRTAIEKRLQLQ